MTSECILWEKKIGREGYGVICRNGKQFLAHRVLWIEDGRELPAGFVLHHLCGQRACVNLEHLEPLTNSAHVQLHKPRQVVCAKCGDDNFYNKLDGRRRCKTCAKRQFHGIVVAVYSFQNSEIDEEEES